MITLEHEKINLTAGQARRINTINEIVKVLETNRDRLNTPEGRDALVFDISRRYGFNLKTARDYLDTAIDQLIEVRA